MLVPLATIGATFAYAKVKEKRSYKSFLIEQVFKVTRSKLTFSTVEGAQRAQSVIQYETKGLHQQPKYQFENTVERCDQDDTTTYIINQQRMMHKILYYIFTAVLGLKIHCKAILNLLIN